MHQVDQDIIDDFLLEVARRRLSLRGRLLDNRISRAIKDMPPQPTNQEVYERLPVELLKMAMKWPAIGVIEIRDAAASINANHEPDPNAP